MAKPILTAQSINRRQQLRNLTGMRFGRWVVEFQSGKSPTRWRCRCDCGTARDVRATDLTGNKTTGCRQCWKSPLNNLSHGHTVGKQSPTYIAWLAMRQRCNYPGHKNYADYGGRGIRVCDRWLGPDGFATFLADMGEKPGRGYTLDRFPDPNGDYRPGNVRWATQRQQCRNKRNNVRLTFRGETRCMIEWAEHLGISISTISDRLRSGWSVDEALSTPIKRR